MLTRLIIRFFIICVFFTIFLSLIMLYVYQKLDEKDTLDNFKIMNGIFSNLDNVLQKYPVAKWQQQIDKMRPQYANEIKVIPINTLNLSDKQIRKLESNEII
jgi:hypothetical protein